MAEFGEDDDDEIAEELTLEQIESQIDSNELQLSGDLPCQREPNRIIDDSLVSDHLLHKVLPRVFNMKQRDEQRILEENGLSVQRGRFTKVENALLTKNWELYLEDYIVPNPQLLFGNFRRNVDENHSEKLYYRSFAIHTKLMLRLANGLNNRTLSQIYQRSRLLFSGLKVAQQFTDQDREKILDLHRIHGEQYSVFCEKHGYHPRHAREVVRNSIKTNGTKLNHGPWSNEEMIQLRENVLEVMAKENLQSYDKIPWSRVAASMNRSDVQCRQRFFSKIMFLLARINVDIDTWDDKFDMARLIALMKRCNWSEEALVDWDFLKEQFSIECFNILSRSWRSACQMVPNKQEKTFVEIVDYLYETRVLAKYKNKKEKMNQINAFVEKSVKDFFS